MDAGVPMVECDVTLSKDGELIIIHDETLDRTTDGKGRVRAFDTAYLKTLDAGSWFSREYAGEKIPTLLELLDLARGTCKLNIEIKSEAVLKKTSSDGIEAKVAALVKKYHMEQDVIVSSFHPTAIQRVKNESPKIKTALLLWRPMYRAPRYYQGKYACDAIHMNVKRTKKIHIQLCLEANIEVRVYTVNDVAKAKALKLWGATGIFTDNPERIAAALR